MCGNSLICHKKISLYDTICQLAQGFVAFIFFKFSKILLLVNEKNKISQIIKRTLNICNAFCAYMSVYLCGEATIMTK